ncbi:MAG: hypothetical protein HUU35_00555 [Armatimonadetes bacterium]|nr:hypothetical protein [Armatimonadota bacterium]
MLRLLVALVLAGAISAAPAAPAVVFGDDFEADGRSTPPTGWSMWGAEAWKIPANYTRDLTQPHGGTASFRIHHPANTAGYVVSSPDRAIRPQAGMIYAARFWARAARPGIARFAWTAYESIAPFKDAPSPGSRTLAVTPEWQPFEVVIREGVDFRASQARYLLLTFQATSNQTEEQTLWVDDLTVEQAADPNPVTLIDPASLAVPPLEHRLQPGERLAVRLDPGRRQGPTNTQVGGISFHRVAGWTGQPYNREGKYTLEPRVEAAIRDLRLPLTRFYGVGDEPWPVTEALDKLAEVCRRVDIPLEQVVVELEDQGANRQVAPEAWAAAARHARSRGYGFRYWEIGNEVYSSTWGTNHGAAYPTPDAYIEHVKAVSKAIRAELPEARIGLSVTRGPKWGDYVMAATAGAYDFVAHHYYASPQQVHARSLEAVALSENYRLMSSILRDREILRAYNPGREVYELDTEWGLHSMGPNGERADYVERNANTFGMLHRAVRLIYYARENLLAGASSWQMLSAVSGPGFGILSQQQPDKQFLMYWLYWLFNRHLGPELLSLEGTAPWHTPGGDDPHLRAGEHAGPLTPVLATIDDDAGTVYLVVVNASANREVPCEVSLGSFAAGSASGQLLRQANPDDHPLVVRDQVVSALPITCVGSQVSFTVPSHGVAFVTVKR